MSLLFFGRKLNYLTLGILGCKIPGTEVSTLRLDQIGEDGEEPSCWHTWKDKV